VNACAHWITEDLIIINGDRCSQLQTILLIPIHNIYINYYTLSLLQPWVQVLQVRFGKSIEQRKRVPKLGQKKLPTIDLIRWNGIGHFSSSPRLQRDKKQICFIYSATSWENLIKWIQVLKQFLSPLAEWIKTASFLISSKSWLTREMSDAFRQQRISWICF